jgi:hypothetical protein
MKIVKCEECKGRRQSGRGSVESGAQKRGVGDVGCGVGTMESGAQGPRLLWSLAKLILTRIIIYRPIICRVLSKLTI